MRERQERKRNGCFSYRGQKASVINTSSLSLSLFLVISRPNPLRPVIRVYDIYRTSTAEVRALPINSQSTGKPIYRIYSY